MTELGAWLASSPAALIVVCALLGLLIGSFLNVVILRLPARLQHEWEAQSREILALGDAAAAQTGTAASGSASQGEADAGSSARAKENLSVVAHGSEIPAPIPPPDLVFARSRCPQCGHNLAPWENIPLLSFLLLRGRCRACRNPISWQYPLVELLTGLAFAVCAWRFGVTPQLAIALVVSASLVALSGIDVRTQLLPDQITLPLLWFALLAAAFGLTIGPVQAIFGAAVGYLSLWSVYWLFKLLTGKEGMGYGDFKLLAALGALVGVKGILPIVLIASFLGAIIGGIQLAVQGRDRATPIPFGPYLAAAGFIQLVMGSTILAAWNGWFRLG